MSKLSPEQIRQMVADAKAKHAAKTDHVPSSRSWHEGLFTAEALQSKQFKPVRIILPDLIPEGTTILAGKPKIGKSWLALDVCMAVADETRFVLGDKRPICGDVLYLALEDNERRLKKRIDKIAQGQARWSNRLAMHTEWKRVDQGGLEDIEAWCKSVEEPRLIWIDTLAKIRPIGSRNEQAYSADYRSIEGLQKLSGQYQVGIVVNHHLRKMVSDDAFDEVSGTLGLNGAADTIIVMKRHSGMMKIHVQGRDIESAEFAAEFNRNTCRWRIVGDADEVFRSQERRAIIAALKEAAPEKMSISDIMSATDRRDRDATKSLLHKMRSAGEVVSEKGRYSLASQEAPLNVVDRVDRRGFDDQPAQQDIDKSGIPDSENGKRKSKWAVNSDASVDRALTATDSHRSLAENEDLHDSQRVNAVNGSYREMAQCIALDPSDPGPIPDFLLRAPKAERPPSLRPLGDSLDDLQ